MKLKKENIPLLLTLSRLIISPLILPIFLVWLLPLNNEIFNYILAGCFILLALTDLFDGYLARKFKVESELGTILDPIADKFLIYATLIALLAAGKINYYWVILLIGRELFVMGLRLIAAQKKMDVPVSKLAKVKTAFQMVMLTYIIWNPYQVEGIKDLANGVEWVLIIITVVLSLVSAYFYCKMLLSKMITEQETVLKITEEE